MRTFDPQQLDPAAIQGLSIEEVVDRSLERARERWMRKGRRVSRSLPLMAATSLLLWIAVWMLVQGRGFEGSPAAVHLACWDAVLTGVTLGMVPRWRAYRFHVELENAEPLEPYLAEQDEATQREHG